MRGQQNGYDSGMARRVEARDSLDDFPTPPWAVRALLEHVILGGDLRRMSCLEPACGRGHMAETLAERFGAVEASDIHPYGYGAVRDFADGNPPNEPVHDWIITNPPFRLAEVFLANALAQARVGVALLVRSVFIESVGRYDRIFRANPPTYFAQFSERVPMVKGRLDKDASTATSYAWLVWEKESDDKGRLVWIPPCRKALERDGDYDDVMA